jgi:hypothetical protein
MEIRHENVINLYAVKLTLPQSSGPPQLAVLMEQRPQLTVHDLLEDCDCLREERASVRVSGRFAFHLPDGVKELSRTNIKGIE